MQIASPPSTQSAPGTDQFGTRLVVEIGGGFALQAEQGMASPYSEFAFLNSTVDWEREMEFLIAEAFDCDVSWLATSPTVAAGRAEELIGNALLTRSRSSAPIRIATSCGVLKESGSLPEYSKRRKSIEQQCENSLRRLRIDCIDLYRLQDNVPEEELEEGWDTLLRLRERGLIRIPGVSGFSLSDILRLAVHDTPAHPPAIVQTKVSFLSRSELLNAIPWCSSHALAVLAEAPLEGGLLSGMLNLGWIESYAEYFTDLPREHSAGLAAFAAWLAPKVQPDSRASLVSVCKQFAQIAEASEMTPAQLAVAWTAAQPGISAVIIRPQQREAVQEIANGLERPLSSSVMSELDTAYAAFNEIGL